MLKHPDVREAAAIGVPDALRGQVVKAFVVTDRARRRGFRARDPGPRPRAAEPARISAPRRIRHRAAQDAGRQGQSQGAARPRAGASTQSARQSTEGNVHADRDTNATFPKITEEGLDDLRQRIGVKIGDTAEPWCYEATRDNIRHYAHGIGDDNPLWCDPDYAAKTQLRRHRRAAELPVRDQPHRLGLCRRPARRPRDVVGRRLDLAQAGAAATTRSRPRPS